MPRSRGRAIVGRLSSGDAPAAPSLASLSPARRDRAKPAPSSGPSPSKGPLPLRVADAARPPERARPRAPRSRLPRDELRRAIEDAQHSALREGEMNYLVEYEWWSSLQRWLKGEEGRAEDEGQENEEEEGRDARRRAFDHRPLDNTPLLREPLGGAAAMLSEMSQVVYGSPATMLSSMALGGGSAKRARRSEPNAASTTPKRSPALARKRALRMVHAPSSTPPRGGGARAAASAAAAVAAFSSPARPSTPSSSQTVVPAQRRLRPDLLQGYHYEVVAPAVWALIDEHFGCGPVELPRPVVALRTGRAGVRPTLQVEVYPLRLSVCRSLPSGAPDLASRRRFFHTQAGTVDGLRASVAAVLGGGARAERIRLWCRFDDGEEEDSRFCLLARGDASLIEARVANDAMLLAETASRERHTGRLVWPRPLDEDEAAAADEAAAREAAAVPPPVRALRPPPPPPPPPPAASAARPSRKRRTPGDDEAAEGAEPRKASLAGLPSGLDTASRSRRARARLNLQAVTSPARGTPAPAAAAPSLKSPSPARRGRGAKAMAVAKAEASTPGFRETDARARAEAEAASKAKLERAAREAAEKRRLAGDEASAPAKRARRALPLAATPAPPKATRPEAPRPAKERQQGPEEAPARSLKRKTRSGGIRTHPPGLTGLRNIGNTCYMNSALQCLSGTRDLTRYFLDGDRHVREINEDNPLGTSGAIARAYGTLVRALWRGPREAVPPRELKHAVGCFAPAFLGNRQHDSQEFLGTLLDALHEDLNRVRVKPYTEHPNGAGRPDAEVAAEAWRLHGLRNDSVVRDTFQGQLKSTVTCPSCAFVSITFDPFTSLSLPLPDPAAASSRVPLVVARVHPLGRAPSSRALPLAASAKASALAAVAADAFGMMASALVVVTAARDGSSPAAVVPADAPAVREKQGVDLHVYETAAGRPWLLVQQTTRGGGPAAGAAPLLVPLPAAAAAAAGEEEREQEQDGGPTKRVRRAALSGEVLYEAARRAAAEAGLLPASGKGRHFTLRMRDGGAAVRRGPGALRSPLADEHAVVLEWEPGAWAGAQQAVEAAAAETAEAEAKAAAAAAAKKAPRRSSSSVAAAAGGGPAPGVGLDECFEAFTREERLGEEDPWYCPRCKEFRRAAKRLELWRLPRVVVVHLKRFRSSRFRRGKVSTPVRFPLEGLDLAPWLAASSADGQLGAAPVYDCYAVSRHSGGLGAGHYTAVSLNAATGQWHAFNDSQVSPISADRVVTPTAYLLFYRLRGAPELGVQELLGGGGGADAVGPAVAMTPRPDE